MTAVVPDILYVPLPQPRAFMGGRSCLFLLVGCMVAGLVAIRIFVVIGVNLPNAAILASVFVLAILIVAGLLLFGVQEIIRARRLRRLAKFDSTDELAEAAAKLLIRVGVCRRPGVMSVPWRRFDRERTRRRIPALGIVVDEALREPLAAVGLTDHLVEPERLVPGKVRVGQLTSLTTLGLFAAWQLYRGHMAWGGIFGVIFLFNVLLLPAVLALIPVVGDRSMPVAGPGYVDFGGRRLTVRDSVMIVARGPWTRSVQVILTGPDGQLAWIYRRLDDPEFVRLWQRWAHPNPRLDFDAV